MRIGGRPPADWYHDMYGSISYECRVCKTWGTGPGTSPGLICSYGPATFNLFLDGNAWCATRDDFVNLQESPAGFGSSRREAILECIKSEVSVAAAIRSPQAGAGT